MILPPLPEDFENLPNEDGYSLNDMNKAIEETNGLSGYSKGEVTR